jgi:hypothetical protein
MPDTQCSERFTCHNIPRQEQSQESLASQMREVIIAANRLGLYDAADCIQRNLIDSGKR